MDTQGEKLISSERYPQKARGMLMMAIACGIVVLKFKDKLSSGLYKMIKLFFWCGVSTQERSAWPVSRPFLPSQIS